MERELKAYLHVPFMITKRKDEKFGEIVVMMVEFRGERKEERGERMEDSLKTRLQRLCREHLPKYWQPRDFVVVAKIPMTETGKIARKECQCIIENR